MSLFGFCSFEEIKNYLGCSEGEELDYDIALIDIDNAKVFQNFDAEGLQSNYFVTSFDLYSLKKGLEILSGITNKISLKKILFTRTMSKEEDDYLNFLSQNLPIEWADEKIYFPFEMGDQSTIIENQRVSKIKFRNLSSNYKDSLYYIVEEILGVSSGDIKRVKKILDKS